METTNDVTTAEAFPFMIKTTNGFYRRPVTVKRPYVFDAAADVVRTASEIFSEDQARTLFALVLLR